MSGRVGVRADDGVGWLVFDHPEKRNAVSASMWKALPVRLAALEGDDAVRVLVLRGAGVKTFVSGADTSEFLSDSPARGTPVQPPEIRYAMQRLERFSKPILAMIHGACIGGGLGIALRADLRFAADDAFFSAPAARLGVGYPIEDLERLESIVGPAFAKEMLFTGRRVAAGEARNWGLVNAVLARVQLESQARTIAAMIADRPRRNVL